MLSKIRHYVPFQTLRSIYYSIFSSNLTYGSQIWGQNPNYNIKRIMNLQKKAIKVINFANFNDPVDPLYQHSKIIKFTDSIKLSNLLTAHDSIHNKLPVILNKIFILRKDAHNYTTRNCNMLTLPPAKTTTYGIKSIEYQCVTMWNRLIVESPNTEIHSLNRFSLKKIIQNMFLTQS